MYDEWDDEWDDETRESQDKGGTRSEDWKLKRRQTDIKHETKYSSQTTGSSRLHDTQLFYFLLIEMIKKTRELWNKPT